MKINRLILVASVISLGYSLLDPAHVANADHMTNECAQVEAIFARGSGQPLKGLDATKFFTEFQKRVPQDKVSQNTYELGLESYGGHQYEAIEIRPLKAAGAKISSGYSYGYGDSVDSGVGELYNYLTQRYEKCKTTQFVLGGFSQGAQVVGQTLPKLSTDLRSNIAFTALFGDPKLYLPEGEGELPPACQGKQFSPWRRIIANCRVHSGSLNARKPYLPSDMAQKTGLWCYTHDYICGAGKDYNDIEGHGWYKDDHMAIEVAVGEAAARLATVLPQEQAEHLLTIEGHGYGTTGLDVAFVLDTTGSMGTQIESSKEFIRQSAQKIKDLRGRVALTVYRDYGDVYTAQILSPLQSDTADLLSKLDGVTAADGGDWEEAGLHALMTTFNGLNWQDGATKATIMLTDAPFHEPDQVDGVTIEQVAKRSLEIDPVNVYPVLSNQWGQLDGPYMDQFNKLADLTSGQVIIDSGDTVGALTEALARIEERPTAILKNLEYQADVGREITFDASDSYVIDASITQYDWDFEGDGVFDLTTTEPAVDYTYDRAFDGNMQVRLTADNDTISSASAIVKVGTYVVPAAPAAPKNLTVKVLSTSEKVSSVELSWSSDAEIGSWLISVNDVPLGIAESSQVSIEITDVKRSIANVFSVAAVSTDGVEGEASTVQLDAEADSPAPEQPKLSWWQKLLAYLLRLIHSWKIA